ncbi:MAG: 2-dehydropantoate 2-reductase [Coxiellaceae bacterium]|nr:2-dehydropantoate 2-reductase [Coxiellaceae bacterium]
MRNTYLVMGTGALGAHIGSLLHRSEKAVVFHCRSNYSAIQQSGLTVSDQEQSWTSYNLLLSNELATALPCSVGLLCIKSYENDNLLCELAKINYPKIIICMQNGIGIEEKILQYLPDVTVISAVSFIKVTPKSKNHFHHNFGNTVALAQYNPSTKKYLENTEILSKIKMDFISAGITVNSKKFKDVLWTKLAFNVPLCLLSIIYNQSTTALVRDDNFRARFFQLLKEIEMIAQKEGADIDLLFIMADLKRFSSTKTEVFHSMKTDFDNNKRIESEAMFDNVIKIARKHNLQTPLLDQAMHQLSYKRSISAIINSKKVACRSGEDSYVSFLRSSL